MRSWPKAGWCGWGWVSKRCIGSGVKSKVAGFLPPLQSRSSWSPTLARLSPAPPLGDPSLAIWLRSKFWSACKAQPDGFLWPQALCVTPMFSEWMSGAPHWPCGSLPVHNDMDIFQENFPCKFLASSPQKQRILSLVNYYIQFKVRIYRSYTFSL